MKSEARSADEGTRVVGIDPIRIRDPGADAAFLLAAVRGEPDAVCPTGAFDQSPCIDANYFV